MSSDLILENKDCKNNLIYSKRWVAGKILGIIFIYIVGNPTLFSKMLHFTLIMHI